MANQLKIEAVQNAGADLDRDVACFGMLLGREVESSRVIDAIYDCRSTIGTDGYVSAVLASLNA